MKYQGELSIVGACGGYSKTPAKHAPAVGNSVLNSLINNLGSGSKCIHALASPNNALRCNVRARKAANGNYLGTYYLESYLTRFLGARGPVWRNW
jgi:hypothetical protein